MTSLEHHSVACDQAGPGSGGQTAHTGFSSHPYAARHVDVAAFDARKQSRMAFHLTIHVHGYAR